MSDFDDSDRLELSPKSAQSNDLRTRIAAVQKAHTPDQYEQDMGECPCGFKYSVTDELAAHVADVVIRELRPQLAAWARMCVDSGDMTPMAQRMLHNILGQA